MNDVTTLLNQLQSGDHAASDELLALLYDELRRQAAGQLAKEKPGQTLQATALVHEAYLRLVGPEKSSEDRNWSGRGHFFAAAAEAMRRILVERATIIRCVKDTWKIQLTGDTRVQGAMLASRRA